MDHCEQCGFVYESLPPGDIGTTIRSLAHQMGAELVNPGAAHAVGTRPAPDVWSALEYACHVRDVLLVQRERVLLAQVEEVPSFARMYRDERVSLAGYADERPEDVAGHLTVAAALVSRVFAGLTAEQLARRCIYNFPAPMEQDVAWLGRHTAHEASHHLGDVRSVLARLDG
ncbi:MAG: DinB family protein [Acidimicrobiaceae bacterium]|nr:DinB family protein [Acidimicrobiaceae bacterium]